MMKVWKCHPTQSLTLVISCSERKLVRCGFNINCSLGTNKVSLIVSARRKCFLWTMISWSSEWYFCVLHDSEPVTGRWEERDSHLSSVFCQCCLVCVKLVILVFGFFNSDFSFPTLPAFHPLVCLLVSFVVSCLLSSHLVPSLSVSFASSLCFILLCPGDVSHVWLFTFCLCKVCVS